MKCNYCGENIKNNIIAYCEKCEEYYCMNCSRIHKNHGLTFFRINKNQMIKINIGVSGAGIGNTHHKFYTDYDWISRKKKCPHVNNMVKLGYPIFFCEDGKIRCFKCFNDSKMTLADPLIKINENKLQWLLPYTYDPINLDFTFNCDNNCIKGEDLNLNLTIKNNKQNPLKDINIYVEAFSAPPLPETMSFNEYSDYFSHDYLIFKEFHFDTMKPNETITISYKVKIPLDYEIKKGQLGFYSTEKIGNPDSKIEFLKVPDKLMIYAQFTYQTRSGFQYWSYIKSNLVKISK